MSERVSQLLDKALQTLDPRERDELLRGLLLGQLGAGAPLGSVRTDHPPVDSNRLASLLEGEPSPPSGVPLKVLPVRLPATDHERLRGFCQASGFSMAVVVRTLVERFLDQNPAPTRPE